MFWFKNAMIYRLTQELDWSEENLQEKLAQQAFQPCQQQDMSKFGWANLLPDSDLYYFTNGKQILLMAQKEEKILPASVIKQNLDERIAQLEEKEGRKLKKTEKQSLKEDVIATLLPRAFSKNQFTMVWIDTENQLVYLNVASAKRAEDTLALLRKSLGSLPVIPLSFAMEPCMAMRQWVMENPPSDLTLLEDVELIGGADESIIRCKKQDLSAEEVQGFLQAGKTVAQLALSWDEHLKFVWKEDGTLLRLKFADELLEQNADIEKGDFAQRLDADFLLMTSTLQSLSQKLISACGGEKERL